MVWVDWVRSDWVRSDLVSLILCLTLAKGAHFQVFPDPLNQVS